MSKFSAGVGDPPIPPIGKTLVETLVLYIFPEDVWLLNMDFVITLKITII